MRDKTGCSGCSGPSRIRSSPAVHPLTILLRSKASTVREGERHVSVPTERQLLWVLVNLSVLGGKGEAATPFLSSIHHHFPSHPLTYSPAAQNRPPPRWLPFRVARSTNRSRQYLSTQAQRGVHQNQPALRASPSAFITSAVYLLPGENTPTGRSASPQESDHHFEFHGCLPTYSIYGPSRFCGVEGLNSGGGVSC